MISAFDERAAWFDAHYGSTRGRIRLALVLERLAELLPEPPASILDAGGGSGAFAIPLARRGFEVTLLDPSPGMLEVARTRSREHEASLRIVEGAIADAPQRTPGPFDAICCHGVLLYLPDPTGSLRVLRSLVRPGAPLSLLEKNRLGLAFRPGLTGDYAEALRVLDDPVARGNLGIVNRSRAVDEWRDSLADAGWEPRSWAGIRLFSDGAPDHLPPERFEQLLALERESGRRDPYRGVARLMHLAAVAV